LITSSLDIKPEPADLQSDHGPLKKKSRIDSSLDSSVAEDVWLKFGKNILSWVDREAICNGKQLNDHHINYCQCLLKKQFPTLGDLMLTLLQSSSFKKDRIDCGVQIIFCQQRTTGLWHLDLDLVIIQLMCMTPFINQLTKTKGSLLICSKRWVKSRLIQSICKHSEVAQIVGFLLLQ